ncbi:hypothetical protein J132_04777 [Termitomyces sp. J132]|nr:hypothetical protein J132_04777 [Termitomyces sp. J132]
MQHFLLECPHYDRKQFTHLTRALKRKAESIPHLLSAPDALKHLTRYIEATKRFHAPKGTPSTHTTGPTRRQPAHAQATPNRAPANPQI